ncbi:protease inhibitor I42 family protein [Dinghuibacter silviterrae]|uniref:Chagasin family peptidase inhibitor I42 n=1 Tax=Dinghuibacter silviterrae TaxID=1539049 RepID=A0A4R8DGR3_9BACT|nr:chagasin family peptidase inhibitor I42 [Dinghuibacter silviterrae]
MRHQLLLFAYLFSLGCAGAHAFTPTGNTLSVKHSRRFQFSLPSNLGDGHQWILPDTSSMKLISHVAIDNKDSTGSTNVEVFTLRPLLKGDFTLAFYRIRPFDNITDSAGAQKLYQKIHVR